MKKLKFKERVKRRFKIDDDRLRELEEKVVVLQQQLDELAARKFK